MNYVCCFFWIVEGDISMTGGILVRANRASKEFHSRYLFSPISPFVGEDPILRIEGFSHERNTDIGVRKVGFLSNTNFLSL